MDFTPEILKKYEKYSIPELIKKAERKFNAYIRERDKRKPCVSCGRFTTLQAGHYYSAGKYSALRFNDDNCHGQCQSCNYFKHGNLLEYRKELLNRIGEDKVNDLDIIASASKQNHFKWDRYYLIEVIEKYNRKSKELM